MSRTNTTLVDIMPTIDQYHFCNSRPNSNNNLGRTTCVATNLRSYFIPVNRDNTHDDLGGQQSNDRYRHGSTSSQDWHSHRGSHWTKSEAAHRFRAQSAQYDTGTKSFHPCIHPLASHLIKAIHNECHSAQCCHKCSQIAASEY